METQQKILNAVLHSQHVPRPWIQEVAKPAAAEPPVVVRRVEPKMIAPREDNVVVPQVEPKLDAPREDSVKPVEPKSVVPFNIMFSTRSFACERLSSRRLCFSTGEKSCLLIEHSGRIPAFVETRKFVSETPILSSRDWDRVTLRCKNYVLYETQSS